MQKHFKKNARSRGRRAQRRLDPAGKNKKNVSYDGMKKLCEKILTILISIFVVSSLLLSAVLYSAIYYMEISYAPIFL